jgi:hypothetical protein
VGKDLIGGVMNGSPERFWTAFRHLQALDLFYEVAMVFDEDPLHSPGAEPLYPLYLWDRHIQGRAAQEQSVLGGLALEAFNAFDRSPLPHDDDLRYRVYASDAPRAGSKAYVYCAPTDKARVVMVFRLTYLPHIQDVDEGVQAERERAAYWKELLDGASNDYAINSDNSGTSGRFKHIQTPSSQAFKSST